MRQIWTPAGGDPRDALFTTVKFDGGSIEGRDNFTTDPRVVKGLPKYAPDGTEYQYYVVERPVGGYDSLPQRTIGTEDKTASGILDVVDVVDGEPVSTPPNAQFKNTYQQPEEDTLSFTKIWADSDNIWEARPSTDKLTFRLWRRTASIDEHEVTATAGTWSFSGNQWNIGFTGTFPTHHTNGEAYTYFVKETLAEPYKTHYTESGGGLPGQSSKTNTLKTTALYVEKLWRDSQGNTLTPLQLEQLKELGAMPSSVTFTVYRKGTGDTEWGVVYRDNDYANGSLTATVQWGDLLHAARNGLYIKLVDGLPVYEPGKTTEYSYLVRETAIAGLQGGVVITPSVPTAPKDDERYVTEITNSIPVRKIYFVKDWEDDGNRDGVRPGSIDFELTWKPTTGSPARVIVPLDKDTSTADSRSQKTDGNRWHEERTVPDNGTYGAEEILTQTDVGNGYTGHEQMGSPKQDDEGRDDWWAFVNTRDISRRSISAAKTWAGDSAWSSVTRPQSVTMKLQVRKTGAAVWTDLAALTAASPTDAELPWGDDARKTITSPDWAATVTWSNLPVNAPKENAGDAVVLYQYRVVEEAVNGYTTTYTPSGTGASGVITGDTAQVTNTLELISVSGTKTWNDQSNRYRTRESAASFKQRLVLSSVPDIGLGAVGSPYVFEWLNAGGSVITDAQVDASNSNTWRYRFRNLPKYKVDGGNSVQIVYTVTETPPPDYIITTPAAGNSTKGSVGSNLNVTNANFTNALATVSIPVQKTWTGDGHFKDFARPDNLTVKLYTVKDGVETEVTNYPYTAPAPGWVKGSGDVWTLTLTGLPRYEKGTTTPVDMLPS